mgnify:CR=1 FL=1
MVKGVGVEDATSIVYPGILMLYTSHSRDERNTPDAFVVLATVVLYIGAPAPVVPLVLVPVSVKDTFGNGVGPTR